MNRNSRGHAFREAQRGNGGSGFTQTAIAEEGLRRGIRVNRIARNVWELMGENKTIVQIAVIIAERYDLDREAALAVTREIIASFQAKKAIVSFRSC